MDVTTETIVALVAAAAAILWLYMRQQQQAGSEGGKMPENTISASDANDKAASGQLIIVDIRSPAEWQSSGIAKGARAITMNQPLPSFLSQLDQARGGDKTKPVAFICATGNRSGFLLRQMQQSGIDNVMHIGEGMMGSRYGAGWLASGLPVERWKA